jgi:hypothetical protein
MDSLTGFIAGLVCGFFVVAIFKPPVREVKAIPTPNDPGIFKTQAGCVRIKAESVQCSDAAVSLNVLVNDR